MTARIALHPQISFPLAVAVKHDILNDVQNQTPIIMHTDQMSMRPAKKPVLMLRDATVGSFLMAGKGNITLKKQSSNTVEAMLSSEAQRSSAASMRQKPVRSSTKKLMVISQKQSIKTCAQSAKSARSSKKQRFAEESIGGPVVEVEMRPLASVLEVKKPLLMLMNATIGDLSSKASLKFGSSRGKSRSTAKLQRESTPQIPDLEPLQAAIQETPMLQSAIWWFRYIFTYIYLAWNDAFATRTAVQCVTDAAARQSTHISSRISKKAKGSQKGSASFLAASPWNEELFATFTNLPVNAVSPKVKLSQKMLKQHPAVPNMSSR